MRSRQALADAGIGWADVQCAFGGSWPRGGADTLVSDLGLTGLPFINVHNGCATGGSALAMADRAIRSGDHRPGAWRSASTSTRVARSTPTRKPAGSASWYGETGLMLTTQFFAMKIQRYMHEYGISRGTLAKVAAKAFRNGARNPNAWRRQPLTEEEIAAAPMISHPLTQYMFCSPGEGGVALVLCRADRARATPPRRCTCGRCRSGPAGSDRSRCSAPGCRPSRAEGPTSRGGARRVRDRPGIGPADVDVVQLQDTESGAEIMHMAETGFCKDGEQETLIAVRRDRDRRAPCRSTPTAGAWPTASRSAPAACARSTRACCSCAARPGARQVPGEPQVAFTHVYGAPGISSCTVLTR